MNSPIQKYDTMAYTLITGASSGIGKEMAYIFAQNGYDLVLVARSEDALNNLATEIQTKYGRKSIVISANLTDSNAPDMIHEKLKSMDIIPEVLVNNAGFGHNEAFVDSDYEKQEDMVKLNILALMKMCHIFGLEMKKLGKGRILNVASCAAFSAGPYMSVYYASKAFVLSFSQALNSELKEYGVTVSALCPGPTNTKFEKTAGMGNSKMFSLFPQDAKSVAMAGYKACMKGQIIKYHGPVTNIYNILSRILPRKTTCRIAERTNIKD